MIRLGIPEPIAKGIELFREQHGDFYTHLIARGTYGHNNHPYWSGTDLQSSNLKDFLIQGTGRVPQISRKKDLLYYTGSINSMARFRASYEHLDVHGCGFKFWESTDLDLTVIVFWPEAKYYFLGFE